MTGRQSPGLASAGDANYPPRVSDETSLQRQLAQYAEDFQELAGRHSDLEHRYDTLKASHTRLTEAGEILGGLTRSSGVLCLVVDQAGHIRLASDSARVVLKLYEGTVSRLQQLIAPFHLPHLEIMLKGIVDGNHDVLSKQTEFIFYPGGNPARAKLFSTHFLTLPDGKDSHTCWIMRDLSPGSETSPDTERLTALHKSMHQGAMVTDVEGRILAVDYTFSALTGFSSEDIRGEMPGMLRSGCGEPIYDEALRAELKIHGRWRGEITSIKKNGRSLRQWMSAIAVKDLASQTAAYITVFANRDVMLSAQRAVLDTACHDALTGLPHLFLFQERASQKITAAWCGGPRVALLFIGLDRFQWIRDTEESETILRTASTRLQEVVRGCDIIARAGPDTFVVLLADLRKEADLAVIAKRVINILSMPILVRKQKLVVGSSIGCAIFPHDGIDTPMLLKHAETAMFLARKEGGNCYRTYRQKMSAHTTGPTRSLEQEFRQTLQKDHRLNDPETAGDGA